MIPAYRFRSVERGCYLTTGIGTVRIELRVLVWIYHPIYKPVSLVGNRNSKTYMTLTNSVPIIYVSILDLKVWKCSMEVNGNPSFFSMFERSNLFQFLVQYKL